MSANHFDVLIIGGGVSGTALVYSLARFTSIRKIAMLEKYSDVALVNSRPSNNSQTLHCGDIETNYSLEKALKVKQAANMIVCYTNQLANHDNIVYRLPKMVLAVGEEEIEILRKRAEEFGESFPYMQLHDKQGTARLEPSVIMTGSGQRPEPIASYACQDEISAVNFAALSRSFVDEAMRIASNRVSLHFNTRVKRIEKQGDIFTITTSNKTCTANTVVVSACGHSLLFAQRMGYGMEYSCLPVAGSFYVSPQRLNGKVYTIQSKKLPFAAIHGDYDFLLDGKTRLGPTALLLPMLERYNLASLKDFLRVLRLDRNVIKVFRDLLKDSEIRRYIFRNFLYEVPLIRKRLFLKAARKIIPSLVLSELKYARRFGGVRPQLIDKKNQKLLLGEASINTGDGIIFNMTPSPGASSCLGNAEKDMRILTDYLGMAVNNDALDAELHAHRIR